MALPTFGLDELRFAADVARAAGAAAMSYYGDVVATMKEGDSPVTAADHAANDLILARIAEAFPTDAVLSEETPDSARRLTTDRVWIVDPLDGTKEFLAQNGEFAIMIGLAVAGRAVLGVVYRPDGDRLYAAAEGHGSWVEDAGGRRTLRVAPVDSAAIRLVGSRSHPTRLLTRVREALAIEDVMPAGSVGVKCSLIAEGRRDLYIHGNHLKEWDTCAPEVVLREAGGHVSDLNGNPLRYNKPVPDQPDGIIAAGELRGTEIVDAIVAVHRDNPTP